MSQEPDEDEEIQDLQGGLKALVTRLSEAELLLVQSWVELEIRRAQKPALRIVSTPSTEQMQAEKWDGSFVELAGSVRRRIHELPVDRLIVLNSWVLTRLYEQFGYRR